MPRVADYSILADNWWTEGFSPNPIEFTIPKNINKDSRSILGFKFQYWNEAQMTVTIRLNSISVWHWTVRPAGNWTVVTFRRSSLRAWPYRALID